MASASVKYVEVYSMPDDDKIWAMFRDYVFVTIRHAHRILGCKFDYITKRLRRFHEARLVGCVRQSDFSPWLYFITEAGARQAELRGVMKVPWRIQKKSLMQIPHEIGITDCQADLSKAFPAAEFRRWRTDLQNDFDGEVPDLYFDLKDGVGWCPFEYERMNPITKQKLLDYQRDFKRTYIVVQSLRRVENLIELMQSNPTTKLWFTYAELFHKDVTAPIWWTPANYQTKQYSILKPES
jgi:hypothetical protein